ncbi:polysaccharide deacetylase family protein [Clostridium oryzae]|uniref:Poly-beta-1,6-N-acetyl-D-glucosamine N-deacetylase n=1 Tax=Clostridium oryzae TaxID=1450648 RepID=A0A1V4IGS5_9CLOT|nr:polysaccharide deacetylase family protein [Clostridium oryzae]OPJ59182.1 poly-beta-1,6-N-acetyl-D-glucosamine N-deacetylase precursor [Clostridium oryzae]
MRNKGKKLKIVLAVLLIIIAVFCVNKIYRYVKNGPIRKFNKSYYSYLSKEASVKSARTNSINFKASKTKYKNNSSSVPVLMYHSIGHASFNPFVLDPIKFKADMKYLKDNNYTTLSIDQFYDFILNNEPVPKRSVLITLDDGYRDNYTEAYPILKKYGLKATIFVITNYIDTQKNYMTSDQLKEMRKNNIDIESHTLNHENLAKLSYKRQLKTLLESKENLEKMLDCKIDYLAYPFGKYNLDTLKAEKAAGYKMAFTFQGKWTNKSNGILTLNRVFVSGFHRLASFEKRVKTPYYLFQEFYY